MTCAEVAELIEIVAAGEERASEAFRSHVESCPGCAGALAAAMRLEQALRLWPAPAAPPGFGSGVAARIRRERWRADQQVDWVFNAAIAIAIAFIAIGALALFNYGSVTAGIISATTAVVETASLRQARPAPPAWSYLLAFALLGTSLFVWRWAEGSKD